MTTAPVEPGGPSRLFAYGTLAPGRPNAHVLADVPGSWEAATTTGRLVHDGWGAALGYPALVLDATATQLVTGMLLTSDALDDHWRSLDDFEGAAYERATITVTTQDGVERMAQTYLLRSAAAGAPRPG